MPGRLLHHEHSGSPDAPELLLIGSLGTTLAMWDPVLAAAAPAAPAAEQRSVVRVDVRGHGRSPAPPGAYSIAELARDVVATLDQLGIGRISVCGLSIGGMIGMWLAANAPERVARLIVICSSAHVPEAAAAYRDRARTVRSQGSLAPVADGVLERWFTPAWAREHPQTVAAYRSMLCATSVDGYAGCCDALAALDLRSGLPQIGAPTLVIAGTEDRATPPAHADAITVAVPDARLELVGGAAHLASVQCPEAVTRLIDEHLTYR